MKILMALFFSFILPEYSANASLLTDFLSKSSFLCNDGQTSFKLHDTRFGNVKRVEISSAQLRGHIGYVIFWSQAPGRILGNINASEYIAELTEAQQYQPVLPRFLADVEVLGDSQNLTLNLEPVRSEHQSLRLQCKNN